MNLYSINFGHWGPKDSQFGIAGYLLAENDDQVLDWFLQGEKELNSERIAVSWGDYINGENEEDITRERLLEYKGQLEDGDYLNSLDDYYYGHTVYGWELVNPVTSEQAQTLLSLGVAVMA